MILKLSNISMCVFWFLVSLTVTFAQSEPTPTPVGIVSLQGSNNIGQVQLLTMSDAIIRTGIQAWHDAGITGHNIRIGILDQGFGGLQSFMDMNTKTVEVAPGSDIAAYSEDPVQHGTDVLTVIYSIAPDAEYYVCRYYTYDEYRICIDWMLVSNVDILNHSAGVPALPLDGTNRWALEVDRAARAGVLWVNAAGNFAGGFIDDVFTDTNTNGYHEFRGTGTIETLAVQPITQTAGRVLLSWVRTDGENANTIDFDLEVINAADTLIASSTNAQTGRSDQDAIEYVQVDMSQPFGIRVKNIDGIVASVRFVLFIEFSTVPAGTAGESIIAPADSINSLTVGAIQGNIVAPYSSRGPVGNSANKPDLVAPGEFLLPDGRIFIGTSAAAPVVSGVAALVWEKNPALSRDQLFELIRSEMTIDDSFVPGVDNTFGYGSLYLQLPENFNASPVAATIVPSPTPPTEPVQQARVNVTDEGLKLRGGAGTSFQVIENMPAGTIVTVLDGPEYANGYTWWYVRSTSGNEGWSVEAADGLTTLIFLPLSAVVVPEPAVRCVLIAIRADTFQRTAPGPEYRDRGFVPEGQNAADAQAIGSDGFIWWRLTSGLWVRSDAVSEVGDCDQLPDAPGR